MPRRTAHIILGPSHQTSNV